MGVESWAKEMKVARENRPSRISKNITPIEYIQLLKNNVMIERDKPIEDV
jgi:hypothetical protein